jgi:hypothetical protein
MADTTSPFGFPYPEGTDLVRDGAQDIENLAEGVNDYLAGGYLYAGTVYFTSSGSFVKADPLGTGDIGLRAIRVRLVGAGGGSGGTGDTNDRSGGGGGGGGYVEKFITDIAGLPSTETVTRGAGGTAGTTTGAGSAGGNSEAFGLTANGGGGGAAGPSFGSGGSAGAATGGDLNIAGTPGGTSGPSNFTRTFGGAAGRLGNAVLPAATKTINVGAVAGNLFGGGAGGGYRDSASQAGAAGGNGIVIVDCFV